MVRETVGAGAGVNAPLEAVWPADGELVCVCADINAAAARKPSNRKRFFTELLDLGEIERFLILYMVRDAKLNAKDRKGRDFGNHQCSHGNVPPDLSTGGARASAQ